MKNRPVIQGKTARRVLAGLAMACLVLITLLLAPLPPERSPLPVSEPLRLIQDEVLKGESLLSIFAKHNLDAQELLAMQEVASGLHPLKIVHPGQTYQVTLDGDNRIQSFVYRINEDAFLSIRRNEAQFQAEITTIPYDRQPLTLSGTIEDSLIAAIGEDREHLLVALQLSDIFAWDIDFTTDLRKGDTYRLVVEGLFHEGRFCKYGEILSAHFTNDGRQFKAYRFEHGGRTDYYDEEGKALRKAFLKAPLNFRRISSHYSQSRLHPILRIRRAHSGIDYAAPQGTPVSAVGSGRVLFAGRRGGYGNLVIIRHPNGWETCYGHLAKIAAGVARGRAVEQGQVIGQVGATGLATGPHLHYEVRIGQRSVNPLEIKIPRGSPIPRRELAAFRALCQRLDGVTTVAATKDPRQST